MIATRYILQACSSAVRGFFMVMRSSRFDDAAMFRTGARKW